MWGFNYWLGSQLACDAMNVNRELPISMANLKLHRILNNLTDIAVEYRIFVMNFTSSHQLDVQLNVRPLIHIGLCLPRSCGADLIVSDHLRDYLLRGVGADKLPIQTADVLYTKNMTFEIIEFVLSIPFYILVAVVFVTCLIALVAFIYQSRHNKSTSDNLSPAEGISNSEKTGRRLFVDKIIRCFSVRDNYKYIMQTTSSSTASTDSILCINGIR